MQEVSTAAPVVASAESPTYLTVQEASNLLRRKPAPISRAIDAGELRASRPGNEGCWLIRPEDLAAYVERYANDVPGGPLLSRGQRWERDSRDLVQIVFHAELARLLNLTADEAAGLTVNELDAMAAQRGMKASELVELVVFGMSATDSYLSDCGYSTGITAGADGFGIGVHVDNLTPDEARRTGRALLELADKLTPAGPDAGGFFTIALDAINHARGTSHTPESVAESLGIDLAGATKADVWRICDHIGSVLMSDAS